MVPNDFVISYISSILVGTLDWWVSTSTQMSARDFAHLIIKLISNGHLTVLGVNIENIYEGESQSGWISEIRVIIHEGKFHQVKRMFEAVEMYVLYLKRIRMGNFFLHE